MGCCWITNQKVRHCGSKSRKKCKEQLTRALRHPWALSFSMVDPPYHPIIQSQRGKVIIESENQARFFFFFFFFLHVLIGI